MSRAQDNYAVGIDYADVTGLSLSPITSDQNPARGSAIPAARILTTTKPGPTDAKEMP